MIKPSHLPILAAASLLPAHAATILGSWNFDSAGTGYAAANGSTVNVTSGHLAVSNTAISRVSFSFDEVTLSNIGDYVEISYRIQFTTAAWNGTSGQFRDLDTVIWERSADAGYGGWLSTGAGNRSRINELTDVDATGVPGGRTQLTPGNSLNIGNSQTPWRDIALRVEMTSGGVTISYSGDDSAEAPVGPMAFEDTGTLLTTFDAFEVTGAGGNGMNFRLDDVVVTTNVPEPGVALLGGLGLLGLMRRRRS